MYDLKNLDKLKSLNANATDAMKAFWAFDMAAMADGAIAGKYKELMALAIALTTQCPYCIEIHGSKAREAGASEQEVAEVVVIAAALRAKAAITHGTHTVQIGRSKLVAPEATRLSKGSWPEQGAEEPGTLAPET